MPRIMIFDVLLDDILPGFKFLTITCKQTEMYIVYSLGEDIYISVLYNAI